MDVFDDKGKVYFNETMLPKHVCDLNKPIFSAELKNAQYMHFNFKTMMKHCIATCVKLLLFFPRETNYFLEG